MGNNFFPANLFADALNGIFPFFLAEPGERFLRKRFNYRMQKMIDTPHIFFSSGRLVSAPIEAVQTLFATKKIWGESENIEG